MPVPACHRSAARNKITDPAGAMIFTSSGCGPMPVAQTCSVSIGGVRRRCEPGMTRSGLLLRVNGVTHHIAESVCHGPSVRRLA